MLCILKFPQDTTYKIKDNDYVISATQPIVYMQIIYVTQIIFPTTCFLHNCRPCCYSAHPGSIVSHTLFLVATHQ